MDTALPYSPPRAEISARTLSDLNWRRVLERLAHHCATEAGAALALETPLLARLRDVRTELFRVREVRDLLDADAPPPFGGIFRLSEDLRSAGKQGVLTREPLLKIADTLLGAERLRDFFEDRQDKAPRTREVATGIPELGALGRVLHTTFDPAGNIRDDASPELADLRRRLLAQSGRVRARMESYVGSVEMGEVLQDSYYTIRDGRYVLPVKSAMKPTFRGIIHGSSQTGATVFVEPEAMIPLNNELKLLHDAVEREEYAILRDRTNRVVRDMANILLTEQLTGELDHVTARARLAVEMRASEPAVNDEGIVHLLNARNPMLLLKGSVVVPNDIPLRGEHQLLVITGPNTGGKSVTLSTLGLCTLMTMAGMHLPAAPDSQVSLFEPIHTVFGDPQSIEQDLSTFSGHLQHLGEVLESCSERSLLLMDEIVVGTEPTGGAALAIAVLEALAERGARGLVTTHYDRLKTMALGDPRFQNASVGIDVSSMSPTYKLSIGTPGSSSPIEMAGRLGMDERVVERAKELLGTQARELQTAIAALEHDREELRALREEVARERAELKDKTREIDAERARIRQRGAEIARDTQRNVLMELQKARDAAREAVAALQREKDPRQVDAIRRRVDRATTQARSVVTTDAPATQPSDARPVVPIDPEAFSRLTEGTKVYMRSVGRPGVVSRTPESPRKIEVTVGRIRMTTELDNLAWPPDEPPPRHAHRPAISVKDVAGAAPPLAVGDEAPPRVPEYTVNLRGMRVDEALDEVVRRFDQALVSGKSALYLIHGHGSGALKQAVRDLCDASRYVRRWRAGEREEGGDGVTLAFLQE